MHGKKLMRAAALSLCLVSPNSFGAQDFSALSTTELTQLKPSEMGEDDRSAFRAEMQKRSMDMGTTEKEELRNQMRDQNRSRGARGGGKQGRGGMQGGMGRGH